MEKQNMKRSAITVGALAPMLVLLFGASVAHAQATRTWVSGVGDDVNPCSRTAPCKTFAGAISKTAAGGEIDALDPGGFGGVTITKAITIDGGPFAGGILVVGTNGIIVNAGVNDAVVIRNLAITPGIALNGIRFLAGGSLTVENSKIVGSSQAGISFEPSGASQLLVSNTSVRACAGGGILVRPSGTGAAKGSLVGVQMFQNSFGLRVESASNFTVHDSVASGNANNGFLAVSGAQAATLFIENSQAANTPNAAGGGIAAVGALARIRISNDVITNNANGILILSGGTVTSFGNNKNDGNTSNGAPSGTVPLQ